LERLIHIRGGEKEEDYYFTVSVVNNTAVNLISFNLIISVIVIIEVDVIFKNGRVM
jgi:hypothetical protein